MVRVRAEKVARAAEAIPPLEVEGPDDGEALLLGWGGTYGSITTAAHRLRDSGRAIANAHLRYLNPFPSNLEVVMRRYEKVIIPEINLGQLSMLIRAKFLIDVIGINQVRGRAFQVEDLVRDVEAVLQ